MRNFFFDLVQDDSGKGSEIADFETAIWSVSRNECQNAGLNKEKIYNLLSRSGETKKNNKRKKDKTYKNYGKKSWGRPQKKTIFENRINKRKNVKIQTIKMMVKKAEANPRKKPSLKKNQIKEISQKNIEIIR